MEEIIDNKREGDKIGVGQFYNLITGEEVSWQAVVYDLIETEQLDPWDIDIGVLADRYVEVIRNMEDANFFVSSKVLFACSLLLRIKTERLLYKYLQELDEAIYGKQEDKKYEMERITLDEDEIPILVPKTPLARYRKVTLQELMKSLHKAIETENRRIKKDIRKRQAQKSALVVLPDVNRVPLKERISNIFSIINERIKIPGIEYITFSQLAPSKEEKLASFLPVLHLSNANQLFLEQKRQFQDIYLRLEKLNEEINEEEILEIDQNMENEFLEDEEIDEEIKKKINEKKEKELDKELRDIK